MVCVGDGSDYAICGYDVSRETSISAKWDPGPWLVSIAGRFATMHDRWPQIDRAGLPAGSRTVADQQFAMSVDKTTRAASAGLPRCEMAV